MDTLYLAVSWALVGLIWVIQLVKYPGFRLVGKDQFIQYHRHHEASITVVVLPLMATEVFLTGLLLWQNHWDGGYWALAIMVAAIWLSTFLLQIPQHRVLEKGKDEPAIESLIRTNWIRTILWTAKAGLLFFL